MRLSIVSSFFHIARGFALLDFPHYFVLVFSYLWYRNGVYSLCLKNTLIFSQKRFLYIGRLYFGLNKADAKDHSLFGMHIEHWENNGYERQWVFPNSSNTKMKSIFPKNQVNLFTQDHRDEDDFMLIDDDFSRNAYSYPLPFYETSFENTPLE